MADEAFPYFTSLHANDCYTYQDFDIPIGVGEGKGFRHLILTGKNGSGKTTILRAINDWMNAMNPIIDWAEVKGASVVPKTLVEERWTRLASVFAFFKSTRRLKVEKVSKAQSDREFENLAFEHGLSPLLKQFLVNKKVNQAFAIIDQNGEIVENHGRFFESLEKTFQNVFDDSGLKMIFVPKEYEFYLQYSDGRKVSFEHLADGHSTFLSIVLELLIHVYRVQYFLEDNSLDPSGIVLIDEPEAHLHLELQYQVMPLLASLFPNVQFIVATHSPAVVSSIKDATVFDLTTKKVANDWVVGSSFSELMTVHFGLDNEFSNIADDIMAKAQAIIDGKNLPPEKSQTLKNLLIDNSRYLSPAFHLALESHILQLEEELQVAHD